VNELIDERRTGTTDPGGLGEIGFLFAPLVGLPASTVCGMSILPRLRDPDATRLAAIVRQDCVGVDARVAAEGLRCVAQWPVSVPLHLTVLADTIAMMAGPEPDSRLLDAIRDALEETGVDPGNVVVDIAAPIRDPDPASVARGAAVIRAAGHKIGLIDVTVDDVPIALIASLRPDHVTLHPDLTARLDRDAGARAVAEVLVRLCHETGAVLAVDGLSQAADLEIAHELGISVGCGPLLAAPARRPRTSVAVPARTTSIPLTAVVESTCRPPRPTEVSDVHDRSPRIGAFTRPMTAVTASADGGQVRDLFRDDPAVTSVVITEDGRPVGLLDRYRFLLTASGQFGHALYSRRPVGDLADAPRVLPAAADPRRVLDVIAGADTAHLYDDIVVVDDDGRCLGIARVADLLRGMAELNHDRALALHPVTRLPGLPTLTEAIGNRLEPRTGAGGGLAVAVVAPDLAPLVARGGHRAVIDSMRALGNAVSTAIAHRPGTLAAHGIGDTLVVLTDSDQHHMVDQSIAAAIHSAQRSLPPAPTVHTTWLQPTTATTPDELALLVWRAALQPRPQYRRDISADQTGQRPSATLR